MGLNFCNLSPYGLNLYNNLHFSLHLYILPTTPLTTATIVCHTKLVVLFPMHFFACKISLSFCLCVFHFSAWICTFSRATALKGKRWVSRWKVEPGNCSGDRYQDGLRREEPFASQSRTRLKEWNLTPMERGAKPEECLGQANFDKSQGFSINPWDLKIPY